MFHVKHYANAIPEVEFAAGFIKLSRK